jgi:DNA repair exonuclease SbcCD ATPase subunit
MSSLSDIMNRIQNAREEASSKAEDIQNEIENIKSLQEENNSIAMFLGGASGGLKAGPKLLGRGGKALRGLGEKTKGLGERLSEYSDMPNDVSNTLESNDTELASNIRNTLEQNNPSNTNKNAEPNETDNPHESNLESDESVFDEDRFKQLQKDRLDPGEEPKRKYQSSLFDEEEEGGTVEDVSDITKSAEPLISDVAEQGGRTALQTASKIGGEALSKIGSVGETIGTEIIKTITMLKIYLKHLILLK